MSPALTLILRDFLSSLMTVSLSSSFMPRPSASVISALSAAARRSTGGGFWQKTNSMRLKAPTHLYAHSFYLVLGPLCVILSLLHRGGHLVHGCYDDATGLPQVLVWVGALRPVDLKRNEL